MKKCMHLFLALIAVLTLSVTGAAEDKSAVTYCADGTQTKIEITDPADWQAVVSRVEALSESRQITLVDLKSSALTPAAQAAAADHLSVPAAYRFDLCGRTVDSDAQELDLTNAKITDIETLKAGLDRFTALTRLDLSDTGLTNEVLDELRTEYAERFEIVWTLRFGQWSVRTDATAFSTLNYTKTKYGAETFEVLKYCPNLLALDVGHNDIRDISFLENLPKLRYLIIADNTRLYDITPLATLKDLQYLEMFWVKATDLSPLSGLTGLVDLNVCYCPFNTTDVLKGMTQLERLWFGNCGLSRSQKQEVMEALPNCKIAYHDDDSVGEGWREHPHYDAIHDSFWSGEFVAW